MGDDHTHRVGLSNSKTPIDDIIEHITADLQSYDGQYILLGQPSNNPNHTIWHQFNNTQTDTQNFLPNSLSYENGRARLGIESNMMYTQNTFVDMANSGFVPYLINPSNQYSSSHDPHMGYLYYHQQHHQSTANEYGLFNSSNLESRDQSVLQNLRAKCIATNSEESYNNSFNNTNSEPSPQYYNHEQNFQVIQQQQSHTVQQKQSHDLQQQCSFIQLQQHSQHHGQHQQTQFQQQPSIFQPQQQSSLNQHSSPVGSFNSTPKKTRMVAEVRPMRPSYSDVLAKSIPSTSSLLNSTPSKPSNGLKVELSRSVNTVVKSKKACNVVKNGNVLLKRQHSSGSEEQMVNGFRCGGNNEKKVRNANDSTTQWSSLEDLEKHSSYGDINESAIFCKLPPSLSSVGNVVANKDSKKIGRKSKAIRQKDDNGPTEILNIRKVTVNNEDRATCKKNNTKKSVPIIPSSNNNFHWGVGKTTLTTRNDKKINKSITTEASFGISVTTSKTNSSINEITTPPKPTINSKLHGRTTSSPTIPKKSPRILKRRESPSQIGLFWKRWSKKSQDYAVSFINWFVNLLWDVVALSFQLGFHMLGLTMSCCITWFRGSKSIIGRIYTNPRNWWSEFKHCKGGPNEKRSKSRPDPVYSIPANIPLPATGEEAMKRLLACKGKDAYSILGVTKTCSDDVIKRYYKRQAVLVHPDKNNQPGAEEAFKILIHAFELIGEPEKRKAYDRCILETHQMDKVWGEFSSLLVQLHKKMEYAANTIRCTNCGQRHRRIRIERPLYAARFCSQCKIRHSSREGDIWAESLFMGWMWKYYACMDGSVYDISDWATCQAENLRHLKPNMHVVQYRIVVGKNRQSSYPPPPPSNYSEPDLDDLLSSLYGQSAGGSSNTGGAGAGGGRACNASGGDLHNRIRKKSKKKVK